MMTDSDPAGKKPEKRKVRVKTRIVGGRVDQPPRISRGKLAAVLFLAAVVGVLLGLALGRGIRKAISVHRQQEEITQSREGFDPGPPDYPPENSAGKAGESSGESGKAPGR